MDCEPLAPILHAVFLGGFFLPAFSCELFLPTFYCELFTCELFTCELSSLARLFSSLWSLDLRIVLDGRCGYSVIVCTGSLLRLFTFLLVLYRRSLTALYRFLTALSQLRAFFVPHR